MWIPRRLRISLLSLSLGALSASGIAGCSAESEAPGVDGAPAIEFSNLRVEEVGATRAVVRFDTSVPASCAVDYGTAMDRMDHSAVDPDMEPGEMAIEHAVPLEDLSDDTIYYARAKAMDASGNVAHSEPLELHTATRDDPTSGLRNVALLSEGTAVLEVSSNWAGGDNDTSFGAHKALDGMMSTEWSSAGDGDDAYMAVDLGQPRAISHIAYRSRMMSDGTSIVLAVRFIAQLDGEEVILGPFDTPEHQRRYVFALEEPITTRVVRIEAVSTTGGNTGAKEFQIYAAE